MMSKWDFWIDCGGMFIDIVGCVLDGMLYLYKVLLENFEVYWDVVIQGICELFGVEIGVLIFFDKVVMVKMGMMVVINVLLECKGECMVLFIICGFCDVLEIGYQVWLQIFVKEIIKLELFYECVYEFSECVYVDGILEIVFDEVEVCFEMQVVWDVGICLIVIVLMYVYVFLVYEKVFKVIVQDIGFLQILVFYEVLLFMKLVGCGDIMVVDVYFLLILCCYVNQVQEEFGEGLCFMFMQFFGGLMVVDLFQGKDVIFFGLVGGVVGVVEILVMVGYDKIIGFDMGGILMDVCYYDGDYECVFEIEVVGVCMCVFMMMIYMVVVGGGFIFYYVDGCFQVGLDSVGVNFGLVCYWCGGLFIVIDVNLMIGKLVLDFFFKIFGLNQDQLFDGDVVCVKFVDLVDKIGDGWIFEEVVDGFIKIVVENMVNVIKKIFVQCGYDVIEYVLICFGGVGGQIGCKVVDSLGMKMVILYLFFGILFVYGMGFVDIWVDWQKVVVKILMIEFLIELDGFCVELVVQIEVELDRQGVFEDVCKIVVNVYLCYDGIDMFLFVLFGMVDVMCLVFEKVYKK